ncbi:hypothetical protein JCM6882_002577 [Rhodosporidiobolus microsporus]
MPPPGLSPSQLETLQQLQAITARGSEQEDDSVVALEEVGWDLQVSDARAVGLLAAAVRAHKRPHELLATRPAWVWARERGEGDVPRRGS